jgi:hypothetical protein
MPGFASFQPVRRLRPRVVECRLLGTAMLKNLLELLF